MDTRDYELYSCSFNTFRKTINYIKKNYKKDSLEYSTFKAWVILSFRKMIEDLNIGVNDLFG